MNGPLREFCDGALRIGVGVLAQSSLLLALGLLAVWLLRRRGPELCAFVLRMTLVGVALGAVLSAAFSGDVRPIWSVKLPPIVVVDMATPDQMAPPPPIQGEPEKGLVGPTLLSGTPLRAAGVPLLPITTVRPSPPAPPGLGAGGPSPTSPVLYVGLVLLWAGVSGLLLLWLAACRWYLVRLRRAAQPITDGPAVTLSQLSVAMNVRPPRLLASPSVHSPFLTGIRHPAILLPAQWETAYDAAILRAILAHEVAHLARRDCAWTLLLRLTCAALWMQPLLWVLTRQMEQSAEEVSDQMALRQGCPPRQYADCLLSLAERLTPAPAERTLAVGVVPVRSGLGRRIQNILDRRNLAMKALSPRLRIAIALGTVAAALGALRLVSAASPASSNDAMAVVQQYLDARSAGHYDLAYVLLSPDTQQMLAKDQFLRGDDFAGHLSRDPSPTFTAVTALFFDTHNTLSATYTAVGPAPDDPTLVQVSVRVPGVNVPLRLNLGLVADPASNGELKIDESQTFQHTDATAYRLLQAKTNRKVSEDHLLRIALAILEYVQDNDEVLPNANHWVDEISPYLVSGRVTGSARRQAIAALFHDPSAPASQTWSYAYNRALSHLQIARINSPATTVEVFQSTKNVKNASDTGQSLPQPGWTGNGALYAFVDGHVKWIVHGSLVKPSFRPVELPQFPMPRNIHQHRRR